MLVGAGGGWGGEDFACEEDDGGTDSAADGEEPEAVHETKESGLLEDNARELGFGVKRSVWNGEAARDEVVRQRIKR